MSYPKLTPITAKGTTEPRYLEDRFADVVNIMDFGAVGDGVADDSTAFQAAIDYACSTNKTLVVSGKYKVNNIVISEYIDIEGGGTLYSDDTALIINYSDTSQMGGHISGLRIYAKKTCIHVIYSRNFTIEKCAFRNFEDYGIRINNHGGFELMVTDCFFWQNKDEVETLKQNTGILIETSDATFTNIVMRDIYINIDNKGRNDFINVHCWSGDKDITSGNIFCKTTAFSTFTECYIDTCRYGFWLENNAKITCINLKTLYAQRYFNDGITPVIFYFNYGFIPTDTPRIALFGGLLATGDIDVDFSNMENLPFQYRIKDLVAYIDISHLKKLPKRSRNINNSTGVTITKNTSFIANGIAHINLVLQIDSSIFVDRYTDIMVATGLPVPVTQGSFCGGFNINGTYHVPTDFCQFSIGENGALYLKTPNPGYVFCSCSYEISDSSTL